MTPPTQSGSQEKTCEKCGATVCDVRVTGEDWIKCDWPPLLPVIEFRHAIVANDFNEYAEMVDGELKPAKYTYTGFRAPGHIASMLMLEHRCDAMTKHITVLTDHGRQLMEGNGA